MYYKYSYFFHITLTTSTTPREQLPPEGGRGVCQTRCQTRLNPHSVLYCLMPGALDSLAFSPLPPQAFSIISLYIIINTTSSRQRYFAGIFSVSNSYLGTVSLLDQFHEMTCTVLRFSFQNAIIELLTDSLRSKKTFYSSFQVDCKC